MLRFTPQARAVDVCMECLTHNLRRFFIPLEMTLDLKLANRFGGNLFFSFSTLFIFPPFFF